MHTKTTAKNTAPTKSQLIIAKLEEETGLRAEEFREEKPFGDRVLNIWNVEVADHERLEAARGKKLARTSYVFFQMQANFSDGSFSDTGLGTMGTKDMPEEERQTLNEIVAAVSEFVEREYAGEYAVID